MATTAKKRTSFFKYLLLVLLIPIILAVLLHYWLINDLETPSKDHGSGEMFDSIASRYDFINRVLALRMDVGWRQVMVEHVKQHVSTKATPRLLDVATGTADVAILLAQAIPDATVVGMDPSQNMLAVGRDKVEKLQLSDQITLEYRAVQDFEQQNIQPFSFDAATMAFGIRNVPERDVALCQIHRVLKPDGMLCILEFSEPSDDNGIMGTLARLFIRHVVPILGGVLSGAPREYLHLQNSIKDFPSPEEFSKLIESVQCGGNDKPSFQLEELVQLSFGSVQLYVIKPTAYEQSSVQ